LFPSLHSLLRELVARTACSDMDVLASVPRSAVYAALTCTLAVLYLALIRVYTTWNYHRTIKHIRNIYDKPGKKEIQPVQIPYSLPFLGNVLDFLDKKPGNFWRKLFQWHPRDTGACTLLLGGRRTHILYVQSERWLKGFSDIVESAMPRSVILSSSIKCPRRLLIIFS